MAVTWGTDPEHLAGRARGAGADADEDRGGPLLHQQVRRLGVRRVADRHGDRHEPREVGQLERLVAGGQVARRRDLRLDEEQVRAVLGAERPEPAGDARGRGHGRLRTRGVELLDPAGDQVLADRRRVGLGEHVLDPVVGRLDDSVEDRGRVLVARLDALGFRTEPAGRASSPTAERRRPRPWRPPDRDLERMPQNDCARTTSAGSTVSVPGASDTSSKP
jgi:hypothetical protein